MNDTDLMRDVIQRIATGPHMSRDLPAEDARRAMRLLLEGRADPVQAAVFLIALRMKRETDDELLGVLEAIHEGVQATQVDVPHLLTVVDPYDGFVRGTPVNAFLPALLAATGVPTLTHGVDIMGPKFGVTSARVLEACGLRCRQTLAGCAAELENASIGWSYTDQSELAPELASLADLRTRIVKRPCLTTLEVAVHAVRATTNTLATGYVHKAYPRIYSLIAGAAGFQRAVIIRGVEGGVQPSLAQPSRYFSGVEAGEFSRVDIDPQALGFEHAVRDLPLPEALVAAADAPAYDTVNRNAYLARHAARAGLSALEGEKGVARDALLFTAATILVGCGAQATMQSGAKRASEVLDSGAALAHFEALCKHRA